MFLPVFVLSLAGCTSAPTEGQAARISGMVVDIDYEPISGATVITGTHTTTSKSDGSYSFSGVSNGVRVFSISAPQYTTSYRKATVTGSSMTLPLAILALLDSKVTQVGVSGGVVSNTNGGIKLQIPAGALGGMTSICLTEVPLIAAPTPPPTGKKYIAVIVYITPNGVDLGSASAKLSIPNVTGLPTGTEIPFYHLNTDTVEWQLIEDAGGVASLESGVIKANIHLFGWTAAIVQVAPQVGIIRGVVRDSATWNGIEDANVWTSFYGTVADSFGEYVLDNIPTGEVTVEAIAPGFYKDSADVTVVKGATVFQDLILIRKNIGDVVGKVKIKGLSQGIPGARVVADGYETITDVYGDYSLLNLPVGPITVWAYADGYLGTFEAGSVISGGTTRIDIELTSVGSGPSTWSDDFESGNLNKWSVWSTTSEVSWLSRSRFNIIDDVLHPRNVTLPASSGVPLPYGGDFCLWFGNYSTGHESRGSYCGRLATDESDDGGISDDRRMGIITSEAINLTAQAFATLSFITAWEVESVNPSSFDFMLIQVAKYPYTSWTTVGLLNPTEDPDITEREPRLPYSSGGFNQPPVWVSHNFDISSFVGSFVKIRFVFDTNFDVNFNGFRGWLIDDVSVSPEQMSSFGLSPAFLDARPDKNRVLDILKNPRNSPRR